MKLDPRMVVQFAVIAEEASFTRAAERLCVAQPWLSRRLSKFEEQLGFPLFVRNTRSIALTDKGWELLQVARSVQVSMSAMEALASQLQRGSAGRLRLGVPPYSYQVAPRGELIDRFCLLYSDVSVELDVGWTPGLIDRVLSGSLDLAFVLGDIRSTELEVTTLCELRVELIKAADHPLATVKELVSSDLKNQTIAVFNKALHPELFDSIYSKWQEAGAKLIPFVELNQALLDRTLSLENIIIASFDLRDDLLNEKAIIRRALGDSIWVPFSLVRRIGWNSRESQRFLNLARDFALKPPDMARQ